MTLVEAIVVICVLAALVVVLLPALVPQRRLRQRINCVNNLKEIGLAFRVWEGDNTNYPAGVSVTNGGTMEFAEKGIAYPVFQVMSNELSTPKLLICPEDTEHIAATNFTTGFSGANISYFFGLDAKDSEPQMILTGDDNLAVNDVPARTGILILWTNSSVTWTATRHKFVGNIGLADGSVQQVTTHSLISAISNATAPSRLVIP